jgi:peptidoglycan/xylan/chitin deacetylase (PgdA/CDA1 family)
MMSSAQVRALVEVGMDVGGHTVNHPILARVDAATARWEIEEGRRRLAAITGAPVALFAYPNGKPGQDYGPIHAQMVEQMGFEAAVSTAWGSADSASACFELPRFLPWDHTPERFAARLAANWHRPQNQYTMQSVRCEVSA